jgi:rRNA-processing protein FCF1
MIYAAPDTNVFLHYRHFVHIPWSKILGGESTVAIMPTVFLELEKKKYDSADSRIRKRADTASDAIYEGRKDGSLRLVTSEELRGCPTSQVPGSDADLQILAEASAFQKLNPEDRVVVLTADNAMKVKAEIRNVPFAEMPNDLKLPVEDERDRELKKTRNELNALKNEIPEVILEFENGTTRTTFAPVAQKPPQGDELDSLVRAQAEPMATKAVPMPSEKDYDEKWTEYEAKYAEYARKFRRYLLLKWLDENRVFELSFVLRNNSALRANDIELRLHFPDGFKVLETIDVPREPEAPDPPLTVGQMLVAFADTGGHIDLANIFRFPDYSASFTPKPIPKLDITEGNSTDVKHRLVSIKQRSKSEPITMYLRYSGDVYPKSFPIESEVLVGNGRETRKRKLNVVFKRHISEKPIS